MQADGGFVEDIEDANQAGADAGGQPHPLHFASAERVGGTIQGEILDADLLQEAEPLDDLRHQGLGDRLLLGFDLQVGEELEGCLDRLAGDLVDGQAAQTAGACFWLQARAMAVAAGHLGAKLLQPLTNAVTALGLGVVHLQMG